jgi:hypothetical protein
MDEPAVTEEVKKRDRDPIMTLLTGIFFLLVFNLIIMLPIRFTLSQAAHNVFWPMIATEVAGLTEIIKSHPEVGDLAEHSKCMKLMDTEDDSRASVRQSVLDTAACLRDYAYHNKLVEDRRAEGVRDGVKIYNHYMSISLLIRNLSLVGLLSQSLDEYPLSY